MCTNPNYLYLRNQYPIEFKTWSEKRQHQYNRGTLSKQSEVSHYCIQVPCGHCLECRLNHAKEWATRCVCEAKQWNNNCFLTLTYNDPNLPCNARGLKTLRKKDIQDFLKRLRYYEQGDKQWKNPKNDKIENPIRYLVCGEYGPKGGRPHYHMALFNYKPDDLKPLKQNKNGDWLYTSKKLQKIWGKGFVVIGNLTHESAGYIARYTQKKAGLKSEIYFYDYDNKTQTKKRHPKKLLKEPEFITMSRGVGLGRLWWEENKNLVKKFGNIIIHNKKGTQPMPVCRYFKKLWEAEDWEDYHIKRYENLMNSIKKHQEIIDKWEVDYIDKEYMYRKQHAEILAYKAKFLKRDATE